MAWGAGGSVIQNQISGHGQGMSRPPQGVRLRLQTRVCRGLPWPCLESLQEGSGPPGQSCSDYHTLGSRQTAGGRQQGCSPAQHPSPPPRPPLAAPGGQAGGGGQLPLAPQGPVPITVTVDRTTSQRMMDACHLPQVLRPQSQRWPRWPFLSKLLHLCSPQRTVCRARCCGGGHVHTLLDSHPCRTGCPLHRRQPKNNLVQISTFCHFFKFQKHLFCLS